MSGEVGAPASRCAVVYVDCWCWAGSIYLVVVCVGGGAWTLWRDGECWRSIHSGWHVVVLPGCRCRYSLATLFVLIGCGGGWFSFVESCVGRMGGFCLLRALRILHFRSLLICCGAFGVFFPSCTRTRTATYSKDACVFNTFGGKSLVGYYTCTTRVVLLCTVCMCAQSIVLQYSEYSYTQSTRVLSLSLSLSLYHGPRVQLCSLTYRYLGQGDTIIIILQ